ncbi:MAG: ABC transporter permease [Firmicutes bacterium]|jgi:ABC-2 type transport system permease protein|nr:ABC transporter permease [Bacillota bacterium]
MTALASSGFEAQPKSLWGFLRATRAAAWVEYRTLRLYPANLWLAAAQELTTVGVWYFVALFLSPAANGDVVRYGGHYVAYVLVGVLLNQVGLATLQSPFTTLSEAFWDKRLETYRLAASGIWANLIGRLLWLAVFSTVWQAAAMVVLVLGGAIRLGHGLPVAAVVLVWVLLVAANAGIGLMGGSLFFLLEVKNGRDPITWVYQYLIQIVSGLYIPLAVLPHWLADVGQVLPQTYAFSAMRLLVLTDARGEQVARLLVPLSIEAGLLLMTSMWMMTWALRRAERLAGLGVVV